MHFTREPVTETVITPREGCKLVVRSSKNTNVEDYFVDAVEVVSFGNFLFFRSLERPKAFLLPISDYEVLELKETRMVLKTAGTDKALKITKTRKEVESEEDVEKNIDKKKRRSRRKKPSIEQKKKNEKPQETEEKPPLENKTQVYTRLFPPPTTLIKEKLEKEKELDLLSEDIQTPNLEEKDTPERVHDVEVTPVEKAQELPQEENSPIDR